MQEDSDTSKEKVALEAVRKWFQRLIYKTGVSTDLPTLIEVEDIYTREILRACESNRTKTARILDMSRRTLYRRIYSRGHELNNPTEIEGGKTITEAGEPSAPVHPIQPGDVARRVTDYLNSLDSRSKTAALIDALSREHRTLQQGVTRFCVAWLEHLSKLEQHQYDARNESSVLLARKFVERIDTYERNLPTI